jgi:two-component system OmpR family response regulator
VRNQHVLVAVPEEQLRASLADRLAAAGYLVTAVATGAMTCLDRHDVALIVVDVAIPDLYDLARARPLLADRPPIICMTTCDALDLLLPEIGTEVEAAAVCPAAAIRLVGE